MNGRIRIDIGISFYHNARSGKHLNDIESCQNIGQTFRTGSKKFLYPDRHTAKRFRKHHIDPHRYYAQCEYHKPYPRIQQHDDHDRGYPHYQGIYDLRMPVCKRVLDILYIEAQLLYGIRRMNKCVITRTRSLAMIKRI